MKLTRPLFVVTIAANAALLFAVEPMVSKRVLPLFGGSPSVWNTCLMAFQALLLLGYLYAHLAAGRLSVPRQALLHAAAFSLSLLALPPLVRNAPPPPGWPPSAWLVLLLAGAIGAPFTVLAAGAPLLQRWYARLPFAGEPYFLYAASNVGSMAALLGYPLLIEPRLGLGAQARAWAAAYAGLGAALGGCAVLAARGGAAVVEAREVADVSAPPTTRNRLLWCLLAFVPSSLLLSVTRYVTTDVAPVPLLWVIPLALYLLTFVLAFAERVRVPGQVLEPVFAAVMPMLALLTAFGVNRPLVMVAGVHLFAVAVASLVCHQALADRRPAASRLTEFYLWVSVGGLAGGVFNALVAPVLFDTLAEYPLAIVAAAVAWAAGSSKPMLPRLPERTPRLFARIAEGDPLEPDTRGLRIALYGVVPLVAGGLMVLAVALRGEVPTSARAITTTALGIPAIVLVYELRRRRWAYALALGAVTAGAAIGQWTRGAEALYRSRSFFGAYTVRESGTYHFLAHGTTLHGAQDTRADHRRTPLTYYHEAGPLGAVFADSAVRDGGTSRRVAVVGLGAGTTACYGRAGERWTFYEIDPTVVRIARDPRLFTYLRDCPPTVDVVVGDARLRLVDAAPATFDVILLDAFSSDAIPTHLLTREAVALYLSRLAPDGVLALHVSNRYLNLVPVVAELARDARVAGAVGTDVSGLANRHSLVSASVWIVLARRATTLSRLTRLKGWSPLPPSGDVRLWTDDFTDVLSVVRWR